MAQALVSFVLDRLATLSQECFQQKVGSLTDVAEDVKKLSKTFAAIMVVLGDAEKKQVKDELVKIWLKELKAIAYDIDNVLDEWSTEIEKSQLDNVRGGKRKVSILSSPLNVLNDWIQRNGIARRIKDIRARLEEIDHDRAKFHLNGMSIIKEVEQQKTTSLINESEVFGRSVDKDVIVCELLNEVGHENVSDAVISVAGTGGIGKTTLAQLAFNDQRVKNHFLMRIWVCVSGTFDERRIAKAIIEQVGENFPEFIEWEPLQQKLCNSVMGKRFLLVLDDVSTQDPSKWNSLKLLLCRGAPGSRILVTTRNQKVAFMAGSTKIHALGLLSEEDCWSLFSTIAFSGKTKEECKLLEGIGKDIARKCEGLPHAAKTLGSLMFYKRTRVDWRNVLVNDSWDLPDVVVDNLFEPLWSSYYDMPSQLKRCFEFYAVFPKGSIIRKDDLIKLWMANGLLNSQRRREPEIIGGEYFDDLVMLSFFQVFEKDASGNNLSVKMHDFMHDFAGSLALDECFVMRKENNEDDADISKARHLTLLDVDGIPPSIYNAESLRTLINRCDGRRIQTIPHELFCSLQCLRAADFRCNSILKIPSEVEKLMHLRYIDLSGAPFEELPEAVCSLYNLQTLKLIDCHSLCRLPQGMENLVNLRHLEIDGTNSLHYLPRGVGRLRFLRTLSKFMISKGSKRCKIEELQDLNFLQGCLRIQGLGNVVDVTKAIDAELSRKQHLRVLVLDFRVRRGRGGEDDGELQDRMKGVIERLQPHPNLENLELLGYPGTRLPSFIGKLPNLEKLVIHRLNAVKYMDHVFLGVSDARESSELFPGLKELVFNHMDEWELCNTSGITYNNIVVAPFLRALTLFCCLKLKKLPQNLLHLTQLRELHIGTCPDLTWTTSCLLLPQLEKLILDGDVGVLSRSLPNRRISLPNLRSLKISSSPHWSFPAGLGQLTKLQSLEICDSHRIIHISDELQYLTMLQKLDVICCHILGPRCQENGGEDWKKISHIPRVYVEIPDVRRLGRYFIVGDDA